MSREVRIPVRVQRKETLPQRAEDAIPRRQATSIGENREEQLRVEQDSRGPVAPQRSEAPAVPDREGDPEEWRDRALRLQAEMENFRKRQQRLADQRVAEERERLISQFATIADDLERALEAGSTSLAGLREGVALTHQAVMRLLAREGVEPIRPKGEIFDPEWHEAVSAVPSAAAGVRPNTVVDVVRDGYRIGERLVRPAHVIVAV
jgi:molecular chaperone GrpE